MLGEKLLNNCVHKPRESGRGQTNPDGGRDSVTRIAARGSRDNLRPRDTPL